MPELDGVVIETIFKAGRPLESDDPTYIVRDADGDAVWKARQGEILHIYSARQTGKTSLLKRLNSELSSDGWRCIYINLTRLSDLSGEKWFREFGSIISRELTPPTIAEVTKANDLYVYLRDLTLPSDKESELQVAILLDEIEAVWNSLDSKQATAFFGIIRALYDEKTASSSQLVFALAGVIDSEKLTINPDISPFNKGVKITLADFSPEQVGSLVEHLPTKSITLAPNASQAIWNWTGGHPYLTQRICLEIEGIAAKQSKPLHIGVDEVGQIIHKVFLDASTASIDWNIAHINRMVGVLSRSALAALNAIVRDGHASSGGVRDRDKTALWLAGFIWQDNHQLRIRNEIYKRILAENSILKQASSKRSSGRWQVWVVTVMTAIALSFVVLMIAFGWPTNTSTFDCSGSDYHLALNYPRYLATGDRAEVNVTIQNSTSNEVNATLMLGMSGGLVPVDSNRLTLSALGDSETRSSDIHLQRTGPPLWFRRSEAPVFITPTLSISGIPYSCISLSAIEPIRTGPIHGLRSAWLWLVGGGIISWLLVIPTEFLKRLVAKLFGGQSSQRDD